MLVIVNSRLKTTPCRARQLAAELRLAAACGGGRNAPTGL